MLYPCHEYVIFQNPFFLYFVITYKPCNRCDYIACGVQAD